MYIMFTMTLVCGIVY